MLLAAAGGVSRAAAQAKPAPPPVPFEQVLARARAYAVEYDRQFSLLASDERYVQRAEGELSGLRRGGELRQELFSAYVIARAPDGSGWTPFRDVLRVNGYRVHDRDQRLAELFLKPSPSSAEQATRIMEEGARHNIGTVHRTINIPVLALLFLMPERAAQFEFTDGGTERVGRDVARVIVFREVRYPTVVRNRFGLDQPSSGRIWVEPATGRVVRTEHVTDGLEIRATVRTTYRADEKLGVMVPARMDEEYRSHFAGGRITGTATYENYRRFTVQTEERLGEPRRPPG